MARLFHGAPPDRTSLEKKYGKDNSELILSLLEEKDPEMFLESLLAFAQRLGDPGKPNLAMEVYEALLTPSPPRGEGEMVQELEAKVKFYRSRKYDKMAEHIETLKESLTRYQGGLDLSWDYH